MFSDDPPSKLKTTPSSPITKTSTPDSRVTVSRSNTTSLRGPHPPASLTAGMRGTQDLGAVLPLLDPPPGDSRGGVRGRRSRHKRSKSDTNTLPSRWYGTELSLVEGRHPGGMDGVGSEWGLRHGRCS